MSTDPEADILEMAARVLGSERPPWTSKVAWEPLLDLSIRASGAGAAWIRVGDDLRIVSHVGELPAGVEERLAVLSRLPGGARMIDEEVGQARALGVAIETAGPEMMASVGVLGEPGFAGDTDTFGLLRDIARTLQAELVLWRDASLNYDALQALRVLAKAVANMQLGLTVTDAAGRVVYTNPAEAAMHGFVPSELIGQPGSLLAPPNLRRSIELAVDRSDASWTRESVNRHRDGHDFPVLLWSDVIEGSDGGFRGVVTCAENLAPRRAMEAALQRSETMFRAIFDNAPVGLALIGHDTWIIRANPRLAAMLGLADDQPGERRLVDYVHPDDADAGRAFYSTPLEDGSSEVSRLDHRLVTEGGFLWVHATLSPVHDSAGREQLRIALIEDTTKRRALEEELRHSQKMEAVGRLAGGVAHDFNNLLTAIVGVTELLLLEAGGTHPMADDLSEIHRAAITAADLTRQLLAFSRRQIAQTGLQSFNAIVTDAENMLRRLVGDGIELSIELSPHLALVTGDQSQLEQVVLNLLVNARDATPAGGRIVISTRNVVAPLEQIDLPASGAYVELAVADTGSGIDARTLQQIFDPFFTTKPKGRGTGLGLSTVYGIVKQSHGHIWVDSVVGRGSTFRVWLPKADPDAQLPPALFSGVPTLLLTIGNESRRMALTVNLQEAGYRVLTAVSAEDALRLAETYGDRIDLLLSDATVFDMNGAEMALRLRVPREDMAVIVIGREDERGDEREDEREGEGEGGGETDAAAAAGFTWLDPATDPDVMLERIRELVDRSRAGS